MTRGIITVLLWLIPVLAHAQNISVGNGNKKVNIATGNAKITNNTVVNRKTVNNIVYNIYYADPLTEADKEKLAKKIQTDKGKSAGQSVLIIPRMSGNTDIYAALNDASFRQGLSVVRQSFLNEGYEVVAYPAKTEADKLRLPGKAVNNKSQGIYLSGADICIELDFIKNHEEDESSVTVIMSAYSRETGELIAEKSATSNAFRTTDYGLLLENVVPEVTAGIIEQIKIKK